MYEPKAVPCIAGPLDGEVVGKKAGWRAGDHIHAGPHCYEVVWMPAGDLVAVWSPLPLKAVVVILRLRNRLPQVD